MKFREVRHKDVHQAHVVMGCEVVGGEHPDRHAMQLLNNLLGGPAMTARLNVALREKAGLVYTVESIYGCYPDRGMWEVYFGCDGKDVERCCHLVEHELQRLIDTPLTASQLTTAKKQYKGQLAISRSNLENRALHVGRSFALYGEVTSLEQLFRRIDALTAADLQRVAATLLRPENLSVLIYRPEDKE